jgi:hypothetical protein
MAESVMFSFVRLMGRKWYSTIFLDEAHLFVEGQLEPGEDLGDHAGAHDLVAVEGPALALFELFGGRLADVVQDGGPAQPEVVGMGTDIIEDLQGVVEIVLMSQ